MQSASGRELPYSKITLLRQRLLGDQSGVSILYLLTTPTIRGLSPRFAAQIEAVVLTELRPPLHLISHVAIQVAVNKFKVHKPCKAVGLLHTLRIHTL